MANLILQALSTFAEHGDEPLRLLEQSGVPIVLNTLGRRLGREEIVALGREATGVIAGVEPYDRWVLERMPRLKCISRCGVGLDNIDLAVAKERGIAIRNTPEVVIQPVVELTVAMIFALLRRLVLHTERLKRREWKKTAGENLVGKTVGVLGLGSIGRRVAETLALLGARVQGADVRPDPEWAGRQGVRIVSADELLGQSEILTLHVSVLADHPFVLDRQRIARLPHGAYVVNVARGGLVDDQALAEAILSGRVAGAALDVYPREPYAGPLCDLDNVVLSPHAATLTRQTRLRMETEAVQNLLAALGV